MQNIYGFTSILNVPFIVRRIESEKGNTLKFYDARYPQTEFGQPVSEYYVETIAGCKGGLRLEGSEPQWTLTGVEVQLVREQLLTADERNAPPSGNLFA